MPDLLNLPALILRVVDKFDLFRYFLLHGGRGGGKSQGIARLILYLAEHFKLRIVCGRETQKTIEESVYTIFKDLILEYNLNFIVQEAKIIHRTKGSTIMFKGFREQGSVNIKGLEGVDILWIDEAQAIKKNTLDIIIPTIRKQKAKVFFTMNRHLKNDPVFREFKSREDCLTIKINYTDNPFCSDALIKEAETCREQNPDDYPHIWLGEPLEEADNFLFTEQKLELCQTVDYMACGYHEIAMGVDIARYGDDKCVATLLQKRGPLKWEVKHVERWGKKDLMETTGRIVDLYARFKPESITVDADGMGAGVCDRLKELKINVNEFHGGRVEDVQQPKNHANLKTEMYIELERVIAASNLGCTVKTTLDDLLLIEYTHKSNGQKIIISKEKMKAQGIKSPDDADSLMMAWHATRFLTKPIEEEEYYRTPKKRKIETNLFKIAGYR